jgi:hypothetical protein
LRRSQSRDCARGIERDALIARSAVLDILFTLQLQGAIMRYITIAVSAALVFGLCLCDWADAALTARIKKPSLLGNCITISPNDAFTIVEQNRCVSVIEFGLTWFGIAPLNVEIGGQALPTLSR